MIFNNLINFICQSNAEKHFFFFFKCYKTVWYFSLKNRNDLFKELTKQCKKKTLNFPALKFLLFSIFTKIFNRIFFFLRLLYIFFLPLFSIYYFLHKSDRHIALYILCCCSTKKKPIIVKWPEYFHRIFQPAFIRCCFIYVCRINLGPFQ